MLQWLFNLLFPKRKHKHGFNIYDVMNTSIEPRCSCGKTLTELRKELNI